MHPMLSVLHTVSVVGRLLAFGGFLAFLAWSTGYSQTPVTRAEIRQLEVQNRALAAREDSLIARRDWVQREVQIRRSLPPFGDTTREQQARADSLLSANDAAYRLRLAAIDAGYRAGPILEVPTAAYLIGSALSGYVVGLVRPDPGGYQDSFRTDDKITHASTCAAVYSAMRALDAPRWLAVSAPMLAGAALEAGQARARRGGYASGRDVVANGVGCGLAVAVDWSIDRVRR